MKPTKKILGIASLASGIIVTGYAYISPYIAINNIKEAIAKGNKAEMKRLIDFPALRTQLKDQVKTEITANYLEEMGDNPFAALGMAMIGPMVDNIVDAAVSPSGFKKFFYEGEFSQSNSGESPASENQIKTSMRYTGLNAFVIKRESQFDKDSYVEFNLQRKGLGGWIVNGVQLSESFNSASNGLGSSNPPGDSGSNKDPKADSNYSAIRIEKNEMTDASKYYLTVLTDKKMNSGYGLAEHGAIHVRCENGDIDLYIKAAAYLSSDDQNVKLRWDDGKPETQYWGGSSQGTALFSSAPRSFLSRAASSKKLVAQYTPWSSSDEIAVFKFTTANQKDFKKMQEYCSQP